MVVQVKAQNLPVFVGKPEIPLDTQRLNQISQKVTSLLNSGNWEFRIGKFGQNCFQKVCYEEIQLTGEIYCNGSIIWLPNQSGGKGISLISGDFWIENIEYVSWPGFMFKIPHWGRGIDGIKLGLKTNRAFNKLSDEKRLVKYREMTRQTEVLDSLIHVYQFVIKDNQLVNFNIRLENFEKEFLVAKTTVQVPFSEEQRRYVVQANAENDKKEYRKAINLYVKAIQVNKFSYPAAYYNIALLAAQEKQYGEAIFNMKKYLILASDAPDVRKAQDKIYEWELEADYTR